MKEKKKQKLLKAGFEARARARREKEKEREEKEREERREEAEREADLQGWAQRTRLEHEVMLSWFDIWQSLRRFSVDSHEQDQRTHPEESRLE